MSNSRCVERAAVTGLSCERIATVRSKENSEAAQGAHLLRRRKVFTETCMQPYFLFTLLNYNVYCL